MPHIIKLTLGDPGSENAGNVDHYMIESSVDYHTIINAYKVGTRIIGFDWILSEGNDDRYIAKEVYDSLTKAGYTTELEEYDDGRRYIYCDSYVEIYMFICKLGFPNLKWSYLEHEDITLGGSALTGN